MKETEVVKEDAVQNEGAAQKVTEQRDSFDIPVSMNPWLIYSLAHIPILMIMVAVLYFMYQARTT